MIMTTVIIIVMTIKLIIIIINNFLLHIPVHRWHMVNDSVLSGYLEQNVSKTTVRCIRFSMTDYKRTEEQWWRFG